MKSARHTPLASAGARPPASPRASGPGASLLVTRTFQRRRFALARGGEHETPGPAFRAFLAEALRPGDAVVDLGTGEGRAALAAAPRAALVVGLDRDPRALARGRERARSLRLAHVRFETFDLEAPGPRSRTLLRDLGRAPGFDGALAHLCVSDRILKRAAALLRPGGWAVITALHSDHWHETGRGSRFAYDERRFRRALEAARLVALRIEIETTELAFPSLDILRDLYLGGESAGRARRWREEGRWGRLEERFRSGRRTLTTSVISALARKAPRAGAPPRGRAPAQPAPGTGL